jgi:ParB family chromosome partitioning protein
MEIKEIEIGSIVISQFNTRKDLDAGTEDASLDELASSIQEKGLLSPITVVKREDDKFDLIAGQRRFLACRRLGMKTIPAIIREKLDDTDATILSLIENVHRADMNPMDKARAYKAIYDKYQNYERVAKETSVSTSTVRKYLSLLNLSPAIQEKVSTAEGVAGIESLYKLAQTFKPEEQEKVLQQIGGFKQNIQVEIMKREGI